MKQIHSKVSIAGALLIALSGCGAVTGTAPVANAGAAGPVPVAAPNTPNVPPQVAGYYTGKIDDSVGGKGTLAIQLSASGTSYGGSISEKFGAITVNGVLAVTATSAASVAGYTIAPLAPASPCSYAISATYDPSKYTLTGSYRSSYGCSGEHGKFKAKQQCYYITALTPGAILRPRTGGMKC